MAKAKQTKHTAAELAAKAKAALQNKGGGSAGLKDRLGGKVGHAKYKCFVCAVQVPDLKSMKDHFESKHPKMEFDEKRCENVHEAVGGKTVVGVAVRGSTKVRH
mmetsp:Transcript_3687/g.10686  ORF Transcript_3687/g.10686 Transcript_3687/m.10686 type:complete len:104 (-) Transcript_3687:7667-7978(-)